MMPKPSPQPLSKKPKSKVPFLNKPAKTNVAVKLPKPLQKPLKVHPETKSNGLVIPDYPLTLPGVRSSDLSVPVMGPFPVNTNSNTKAENQKQAQLKTAAPLTLMPAVGPTKPYIPVMPPSPKKQRLNDKQAFPTKDAVKPLKYFIEGQPKVIMNWHSKLSPVMGAMTAFGGEKCQSQQYAVFGNKLNLVIIDVLKIKFLGWHSMRNAAEPANDIEMHLLVCGGLKQLNLLFYTFIQTGKIILFLKQTKFNIKTVRFPPSVIHVCLER